MRLAFVSDKSAPFFTGGYEVRIFELARRLARSHDVRVYSTTPGNSVQYVSGVEFVPIIPSSLQPNRTGARNPLHSLAYSIRLSKHVFGNWEPDAVFVQAIPYLHLVMMRGWIQHCRGTKILDVCEAWDSYPTRGSVLSKLRTRLLRVCLGVGIEWSDIVTSISCVTNESLRTNYRLDAHKLRALPMGLDTQELGKKLSHIKGPPKYDFVTIGRLVTEKRHGDFLHALAVLKRTYGWGGRAILIGDGPLMTNLVSLSRKLGLGDSVEFAGFLPEEDKELKLRDSRIFVLASEREGFSLATLEAMALGLPAVVAVPHEREVFGVSEFVKNWVNGRYFALGDIEELAATLHQLLHSDSLLRELGSRAKEASARYDWDSVSADVEFLLTQGIRDTEGGHRE